MWRVFFDETAYFREKKRVFSINHTSKVKVKNEL